MCVTHTYNSNLEHLIIKNRYLLADQETVNIMERNDSNQNTSQSLVSLRACVKDKSMMSAQCPQSQVKNMHIMFMHSQKSSVK